jgi:CRP/FNR family nitrogen fixation transcriptional regulator
MNTRTSIPANGAAHYRHLLLNRPHPLKSLDSLATMMPCHRRQDICSQGCPAEHWYCIIVGTARRYVDRPDGHRQIIDLLLPGDVFGFTTGAEYDFAVEAVGEDTVIASYPRRQAERMADADPRLAREILQVAFVAISRLQTQLLTLGRITAQEKVGSFILELAARLSGEGADKVVLPISRYDIADYLAVSVETVSRSLTDLKNRGVIKLSGPRLLNIVDRDALEEGGRGGNGMPTGDRVRAAAVFRRPSSHGPDNANTARRMASAN